MSESTSLAALLRDAENAYDNRDREALKRILQLLAGQHPRERGLEWRLREACEHQAALLEILRQWEPDHSSGEDRRTMVMAREHVQESRAYIDRK